MKLLGGPRREGPNFLKTLTAAAVCDLDLGERAHMGDKNTGIWDSQIWDPRYLVLLFLCNSR